MSRAPGKPTCSGVTSRHSKSRISRRLQLCSRVSARVWVVSRGGKFPRRQQGGRFVNEPDLWVCVYRDKILPVVRANRKSIVGNYVFMPFCSCCGDDRQRNNKENIG